MEAATIHASTAASAPQHPTGTARRVQETLDHYSQIIEALETGQYDGLQGAVRQRLLDRLRADQAAVKVMARGASERRG